MALVPGMSQMSKVPSTIVNKVVKAGAFAGGLTAGAVITDTINNAVPQASFPIGNARIGLGDAVTAVLGTVVAASGARFGGEMGKQVVEYATTGIVGGWAINKITTLMGQPPIFNNPFPNLGGAPAAFARARNLYGGRVIPSQAYAARGSFAVNPA